jgi:hypothetical protein
MQATTTRKLAGQRPMGVGILTAAALAAGLAIGAIAGINVKSVAAPAPATVSYGLSPDAQDSSLQAKPATGLYLSPDERDELNAANGETVIQLDAAKGVTANHGVSGGLANPAPRLDTVTSELPNGSQWSRVRDEMRHRSAGGSTKVDYGYSSTHPAAR